MRWLVYVFVSLFAFYKLSLFTADPPELTNHVSEYNIIVADGLISINRIERDDTLALNHPNRGINQINFLDNDDRVPAISETTEHVLLGES